MRDVRVEPRALGQDVFYSSDQGDVGQRARRGGLGPVGGCLHLRLSLPREITLLPGVAHADVALSSVTDDDRLRKQTPPPRREGAVCLLQKIHAASAGDGPGLAMSQTCHGAGPSHSAGNGQRRLFCSAVGCGFYKTLVIFAAPYSVCLKVSDVDLFDKCPQIPTLLCC